MPPKPLTLLSLVQSISYPPLPTIEELEQLSNTLKAQRTAAKARLANMAPPPEEERTLKKQHKRKDREQTDERERAALAANQRAGAALEVVERRRVDTSADIKVKHERVSPVPSNASSASFRPNSQQTYGMPKKKKQKRVVDSDDEPLSQTPQPQTAPGVKIKLPQNKARPTESPAPSVAAPPSNSGNGGIDWSPPTKPLRPLIPERPGVKEPLSPGPKRQNEVDEDFSDRKAPPGQIACQTFWQSVEPYTRDLRHDDLAVLAFKADQPDLFQIPPRGRHFTEIWDEEDGNPPNTTQRPAVPPILRPRTTRKSAQGGSGDVEEMGAFSERLVSGVVSGYDLGEKFQRDVAGIPEPEGDLPSDIAMPNTESADMEERVKKEMRHMMLLGEHEEFDATAREDDEVTAALRTCQAELQAQIAINEARKARLVKQAESRLAYNEYQNYLEAMDKFIETEWAKRTKKHGSGGKKKMVNGVVVGEGRPPVNPELLRVVRLRQQWVETVGTVLKKRPEGEVLGIPQHSIYDGIGDNNVMDRKPHMVKLEAADGDEEHGDVA
ncbi:hypothetical protein CC85DRAFT_285628 [Cutaneotrichosporon oleaginosum]|uniref:Histone acetyltransferases subunit 3-domain-containing protein n=1 Tax=Cutaneotrichosporon oleaginosum TaxID=879819 RepID=A0A0J0XMS9_9TREE|nr:uncharacterized protein CC85DRAFT_285628 [Cutaneotrichosporon oleaginosum]KLT42397.1 hypothetical protein CC85DRAFT_285628 [Cutaneotrichosporon oleaginosum]TXT04216.1 hypothetical protein COLE_07913 [Cutaneotrichosporon oleaginosum]